MGSDYHDPWTFPSDRVENGRQGQPGGCSLLRCQQTRGEESLAGIFRERHTQHTGELCERNHQVAFQKAKVYVGLCLHVFTHGGYNLIWKWAQLLAHGCFFISGTSLVTAQNDLPFVGLVSRDRRFKDMKLLSKCSLKPFNFSLLLMGFFGGEVSSL